MTKQLVLMNGEPDRPSTAGLLDARTKELGRLGVLQARAALAEASRRAADRDAARLARREKELARRAEAARRFAAARGTTLPAPDGPATEAA